MYGCINTGYAPLVNRTHNDAPRSGHQKFATRNSGFAANNISVQVIWMNECLPFFFRAEDLCPLVLVTELLKMLEQLLLVHAKNKLALQAGKLFCKFNHQVLFQWLENR